MTSLRQLIRIAFKILFSALFIVGGMNHFRDPDFYVRMVPPWLPWPHEIVFVSGFAEILLGLLFLIPRFTRPAAWGLVVLLIAVFPANLHMALHSDQYQEFNPVALWLRLPLQGLLIAWAWAYAAVPSKKKHDRTRISLPGD